jgi:hypothetical protein
MPIGEAEGTFRLAAAADGIELTRAIVPWINRRGHFGLPLEAADAVETLDNIFEALGGNAAAQSAKTLTALRGDFFHAESRTFIETDESQHFTSFRALTLDAYPAVARLGFDRVGYQRLCGELSVRSDRYRAAKAAAGFGPGGRQRQRAYNDALRDLVIPLMGFKPVVRVPILDADGAAAWRSVRNQFVNE